jgi:hypothetical protein
MTTTADTANPVLPRRQPVRPVSAVVLSGVVSLLEGALTIVSGLAVFFAYLRAESDELFLAYSLVIVVAAHVQIAAFGGTHLYDIPLLRRPFRHAGRLLGIWTGVFVALAVLAFLTKTGAEFSRARNSRAPGWLAGTPPASSC